ncbi:MAG TPA: glutamine amidotransferase [Methanobacteriaceae archaeon]|nr:glutamine amidotransferase [Methanobacteriaceae archaeon]
MELNIFHMYPDLLNLYGDLGNVTCLKMRCQWRGITAHIIPFSMGQEVPLEKGDIFFVGGGSDRGQNLVYSHLIGYREVLEELIEDDAVFLSICGGYQFLGDKYIDADGNDVQGLGIFDYETVSEEGRLIGNIITKNNLDLKPETLVGFENHGGRTYHDLKPLGKVIAGHGNNGKDQKEGMVYKNCIGTYLHGPLLPKNPHMADYLILKALNRKYGVSNLDNLDSHLELTAHQKVLELYSPK